MDAPCSRRALLATGIAAGASATAGCIDGIVSGDDSPDVRTVAGLGIGNRLDRPIEVSVLLRLEGDLEFWKTVELTDSEAGRDHLIDGPWEAAPGDLQILARYRPLKSVEEIPSPQQYEFTLGSAYDGCIALTSSITDRWGISVRPNPSPEDVPAACPPFSEW